MLLIATLIGVVLFCDTVGPQQIDFSKDIGRPNYANPDRVGYQYCAYWKLADGTTIFSTCDPYDMTRCGKTLDFEYKCCSGFEKVDGYFDGSRRGTRDPCAQVIPQYDSCQSILGEKDGHRKFASELSSVRELSQTDPDQPYTIFAPYTPEEVKGTQIYDSSARVGQQHVVKGRFYADDLKDGMELETVSGERKLRVTRYSYGVLCIECVEVLNADMECETGLVHTIRQPLAGRVGEGKRDRRSVMALLRSDQETKLFAEDLPQNLKSALDTVEAGKLYTVMAPNSQSWQSIRTQYPKEKWSTIAASHVLPRLLCSAGLFKTKDTQRTPYGQPITVTCSIDQSGQERRRVSSACGQEHELIEKDMMAANGVVHLLDGAIVPLSALTLEDLQDDAECAKSLKITEFLNLLKECELHIQEGKRYAIIMPEDSAFNWWSRYKQFSAEYARFQKDAEYRCRVARYHIVENGGRLDNMQNFASHTLGHRTNNKNDYLYETTYFTKTKYGSELNFHYSPINNLDSIELGDVTIYTTPRINVIPEQNLTDILASRPDLSIANGQTRDAKMNDEYFEKNAPKNLYLVTTDNGWKDPRAKPDSVNPNRPELNMYLGGSLQNYLLLNHIPLYLWGGDIGYFPKNSVTKFLSSAGIELTFWMDKNGVMRIGYEGLPREEWPRVIEWNLHARDGIMWLLDGVLKCPDHICPLVVEDIDYYDAYVAACQTANLPNEADAHGTFRTEPLVVARRHPDSCIVILQTSEMTKKAINATL